MLVRQSRFQHCVQVKAPVGPRSTCGEKRLDVAYVAWVGGVHVILEAPAKVPLWNYRARKPYMMGF